MAQNSLTLTTKTMGTPVSQLSENFLLTAFEDRNEVREKFDIYRVAVRTSKEHP